ncbi:MAG: hypothetical protein IJZ59_00555 [Alphaproteobacteria bacterium]|nr:hypothetical protein [Alphaproteobacteria bacterium]
MDELKSNIHFNSNVYPVKTSVPYSDNDFLEEIYDPKKIELIKKYKSLTKKQEEILVKSAVCVYSKRILNNKDAQYFVFQNVKGDIKDICKCRLFQCPLLLTECRVGKEKEIKEEEKLFSQLKKAEKRVTTGYHPIFLNFTRIEEIYDEDAFPIIANTNLQEYKQNNNQKITFLYNGGGNGGTFDNWDGGDISNYFNSKKENKNIQVVPLRKPKKRQKNPLLEYQKKHKNTNNPFFNRIS